MPGCDSEQAPRVCGVADGVDPASGCGAPFHHGCATRVLKLYKAEEEYGGWDVCLLCWLTLCERAGEIDAVLAAAADPVASVVVEVDLSVEEGAVAASGQPREGGSTRSSLLSAAAFSGGIFKLSEKELEVLRGRPFYNKLQELETKRSAVVYQMYRCGGAGRRTSRAERTDTRPLKAGPLDNAVVIGKKQYACILCAADSSVHWQNCYRQAACSSNLLTHARSDERHSAFLKGLEKPTRSSPRKRDGPDDAPKSSLPAKHGRVASQSLGTYSWT